MLSLLPYLHIPFEGGVLDNLPGARCVHADDAPVAQVEHVAGVCQLVVMFDGYDGEALSLHERRELNTLTGGDSITARQHDYWQAAQLGV